MRYVTLCILLGGGPFAFAEFDAPPEIFSTVHGDAEVRSGPGTEYYITQLLPVGHPVEVYRTQGEWCAIRPPVGSFSWLPIDALVLRSGSDVAHTKEQIRTRVGSTMTDDRNVAYVTLREGEAVRLLETGREGDAPFWCKVEPPAGEFRWIRRDQLTEQAFSTRDPDHEVVEPRPWQVSPRSSSPQHAESTQSLRESLLSIRQTMQAILPEMMEVAPDSSDVVLASADEPAVMELSADPVPPPQTAPAGTEPSRQLGLLPPPGPPPAASAQASFRLGSELTKIAADLAGELSRHPATWDLSPLRRRAQTVIDVSDTAEVREQGTNLLARIAQFEDIQRRHRQLDRATGEKALMAGGPALSAGGTGDGPTTQPPMDGSGYDGWGWLMPVVSQNRRVPRYVLTDQQGNILQFVTPSPGLNLSRYQNQKVGIYGTRGFLPSMKQPHLVAERIVTMDAVR